MEVPKKKVTAKLSLQRINGNGPSPSSSPSISPPPHVVVRAKISSTARVNLSNTPTLSDATGRANLNSNGALRPHAGATARRSPSPVKMRPDSPSKLKSHLKPQTSRTPLVKAATVIPHVDRTRQGSISSVLQVSSLPVDPSSSSPIPPTTPLPRRDTNNVLNSDSTPSVNLESGSGSFRIKSKVSGLAKPALSLSTILSPPSPSPSSSSLSSILPNVNRPQRSRATTLASRRPSISLSVSQQSTTPLLPPEQLIPLPTSPPASTLSISSHSSASVSSAHSRSTSTGLSPSFTKHARSESSPISTSTMQVAEPSSLHDEYLTSSPPRRTLIARVRPGTRISGGRTSGSSIAGEQDLGSGARMAELDDRSTDESGRSDDETRKRRSRSIVEDDPEDDVRAEAKSNRKIADLEITTRSLLTINAALEASKLRQAREIRELRRKLREARLAMPPGRFRLLSDQDRTEGGDKDTEEEEGEVETGDGNECDETFKRVKILTENLLVSGRNALAAPAPSSSLSTHKSIPSSSSGSGNRLGLGIDAGPVMGTRMDQGEVLGWDVGSSLGTDSSSNVGKESGLRRWKHGVAIGSKVLSPEEAKPWVGEDGVKEGKEETQMEEDKTQRGHEPDEAASLAADEMLPTHTATSNRTPVTH